MLLTCPMTSMQVHEAQGDMPKVIALAASEAVVLEQQSDAVAVVISPDRYEELMDAYEELQDIVDFDDALSEEGPNIPWKQVRLEGEHDS